MDINFPSGMEHFRNADPEDFRITTSRRNWLENFVIGHVNDEWAKYLFVSNVSG
jgi:hypothetical protein